LCVLFRFAGCVVEFEGRVVMMGVGGYVYYVGVVEVCGVVC